MKKILIAAAAVISTALMIGVFAAPTQADNDRVTLCHAAGQDGTLQYVTLTISYNAAFGQAGHFNEDGTPQAGHEDDYLGECIGDTTTTTEAATTTAVETTAVETTVVETTAVETTVVETTVVETTEPTTTGVETTVPETTVPETTVPATVPGSTTTIAPPEPPVTGTLPATL